MCRAENCPWGLEGGSGEAGGAGDPLDGGEGAEPGTGGVNPTLRGWLGFRVSSGVLDVLEARGAGAKGDLQEALRALGSGSDLAISPFTSSQASKR